MTMPAKIARLAGLGAFGACAGLLALYLLLVYITRPSARGGIDVVNAAVAWIALGGLVAALIIVHVAIGKQLLRLSQGANLRHPL
jgi:membrane associated rhomboid family serine protease